MGIRLKLSETPKNGKKVKALGELIIKDIYALLICAMLLGRMMSRLTYSNQCFDLSLHSLDEHTLVLYITGQSK